MSEIIPRIKTAKKRVLITKIKNEKGECITSRKGIADAFGEFYKRLYEDSEKDNSEHEMSDDKRTPEITTEELQSAISKLKTGKSPDSNGICAEDIKACDDETREMMRQIFNEIIKRNNFTPDEWKKVKIKVIHKKGDVEDVSNYRPICTNCSRQSCMEDYTQCLTKNKQKIRLDSEKLTRQRTTLRRTE